MVSTILKGSCPQFDDEVKVVTNLKSDITTHSGRRCVPKSPCTDRVDGVVWNANNYDTKILGLGKQIPHRDSEHSKEIWFAHASEVDNPNYLRPIGDAEWMADINYAIHHARDPDFLYGFSNHYTWSIPDDSVFDAKSNGIVYMSSNCKAASERDSFMWLSSQYLDVDSVGSCQHNREWPERLHSLEYDSEGIDLRSEWGSYGNAAHKLLTGYHFRLLLISTIYENYFAEKIKQTLAAGTIPIYLDMPNSHDWDPGLASGVHAAMIHIQDVSSIKRACRFFKDPKCGY